MFDHFLITRFNCYREEYTPYNMILDPEWINSRIELFKRFTIPSIDNQVNKNFTWIVVVNEKTDSDIKKKIEDLYNYTVIYTDDYWWRKTLYPALNNLTTKDYIIYSRIDNDDAIHKDFIDEVQNLFIKDRAVIDIPNGYIHYLNNVLYGRLRLNQFSSLIKHKNDPINIYDVSHDKVDDLAPVLLNHKRLWLASIHSLNTGMVVNTYTDLDLKRDIVGIRKQILEIDKVQLSKDFGIEL